MSFGSILYTIFIQPLQLIFEVIFNVANKFIGHPGLAIIVLSLIMNFLVLPLYKRADDMQERQRDTEARLKKGMDHIKKSFSGDERMMILQIFYKQNNYKPTNALNGSVSLLLEIPFFMAAYNFLSNLQILKGVSLGPIKDLGAPDAMFNIGGFDINVLPILMTVINVIASAIYLKGFPLKTKIQLYAMAAFFLVFLYTSPAGLVFYWTLNNLFSLFKNCFYKFKNPGKVLAWLSSIAGLAFAAFGAFLYDTTSIKRKVFIIGCGVLLQIPVILSFFKGKIGKKEKLAPTPIRKNFILGALLLSFIVGLLIPSTIISASPQEFININYFQNPLWFLVSSFGLAFGTFVVWFGVFYWLSSPSGKVFFEKLVWILCGVMTVNYMFFGTDLGILKSNLQYEKGLEFTLAQQAINLGVIAAVAVLMWFIVTKFRKAAAGVLLTAVIAVGAMSGYNIYNTVGPVNAAMEQADAISDEKANFNLSTDGKNVVVIMLDRAMGQYVPYIFNEVPELKEQFNGFTYYSNAISFGGNTNFGVPALFGGYEYTPHEINKRADEALVTKHNEALKVLPVLYDKNGYEVTVCDAPYANYQWIPDMSIYDEYENIDTFITDGAFDDTSSAEATVEGNHRNFFCFSIMKTMPLFTQSAIYDFGNYNKVDKQAAEGAYSWQTVYNTSTAEGLYSKFMTAYNALGALDNMTNIKEGDKGTFLMFTSNATHEPMLMQKPNYTPSAVVDNTEFDANNEALYTLNGHTLKMDTADRVTLYHSNVATYKQLGKWFDYLRENNVWDNTKIILVADHGGAMRQIDELVHTEEWNVFKDVESYYPLLMVKDFGAKEFTENKDFMTNADVPTIAVKDTIENPVNPFTNKEINSSAKDEGVYIITSNDWDISINNGNQFLPANWATVKDDIWVKENWSFIETNTTDPTTVK